jgi:hypothetical protein
MRAVDARGNARLRSDRFAPQTSEVFAMLMTALSSRRALLVGIGALAWCGSGLGAHADDATPLRLGVLSDMSSLYADIGGPGSVVTAKNGGGGFSGVAAQTEATDRGD